MVTANVPFLVGLELLGKYEIYVNDISNELCFIGFDLKKTLIIERGQIYF